MIYDSRPVASGLEKPAVHDNMSRTGGRLAQWLEHLLHTQGVGGSSPSAPTISCKDLRPGVGGFFCSNVV